MPANEKSEAPQLDLIIRRYASEEMSEIFAPTRRVVLWRELWIALAEGQRELGLEITKTQIDELKSQKNNIDWKDIEKIEAEVRHDVMAHVKAYAKICPKASSIIHLGATSAYVTDNADLILLKDGLELVTKKVAALIDRLAILAEKEKDTPTLAFTHFQPAQPTTVGKRACLWMQNFVMDMAHLEFELDQLAFQGVKGTTGTQDSFLKLFQGDAKKVKKLEESVMKKMGFENLIPITGQTYPRKIDSRVVFALAQVCESASKFANDIRLLQAIHEVAEPYENDQIGSSAMPYKQNPMRSERICSLARYVMNSVSNCMDTASTQWFERTLDDSANRRIVLPHAFLLTDAVLDLAINVVSGLRIRYPVIEQHLEQELPFLQTEELLMAAVREGGDRQELHEIIRQHSKEVIKQVREKGGQNDLLARLRKDPAFEKLNPMMLIKTDAHRLTGLSSKQVDDFISETIEPIRKKYKNDLKHRPKIRV